MVTFDTTWKPLPTWFDPRFTSTVCLKPEGVTLTGRQALYFGLRGIDLKNSFNTYLASTPAFAKWPAIALVTRGAAYPINHLNRIAISLRRLTCATRLIFDTSSTVTGIDTPSSVKMRVMPTLRPTRPELMIILLSRLRLADKRYRKQAQIKTATPKRARLCPNRLTTS